jgi:two-component system osmolarity sensor histidine kinase EnvZ
MRISFFWRTFLLIGGLMALSLAATLQIAREFEHAPPEQQIAWEIASIVNLTRSALVSSEGPGRRLLLDELARVEDVRVVPLEPGDRPEPMPKPQDTARLQRSLEALLGPGTRIAGSVNDEPGLWVSFEIEGDGYWLVMSMERWTRRFGPPWWLIGSQALAISLLGAVAISRLVNRPLSQLGRALGRISEGRPAPQLVESGPTEIATLNQRFNRMTTDLAALEADRAVALAGISHDIRTPLTRLRMEVELAPLDESGKASMIEDIERIDRIVGKFVEYARSAQTDDRGAHAASTGDVTESIARTLAQHRAAAEREGGTLTSSIAPGLQWRGDPVELSRIVSNLLENALRHGRVEGQPPELAMSVENAGNTLIVEVTDRGPGAPEASLEQLMRPFARLDAARTGAEGTGLGLAIVDRIVRRHGGECRIANRPGGGLSVRVTLPETR